MAAKTTALRYDGDRPSGAGCQARRRLRRKEHRGKPIGEVHEAEAVRPDQSEAAGARDFGDALLLADAIAAEFGKPGREDHRSRDLAPHAAFDRFAHRCRRQREYRQIDAFRKLVDARQHLAALDIRTAAADQMNGPLELVVDQKLKHDPARRSRLRGHADDRHAARTHHGADG